LSVAAVAIEEKQQRASSSRPESILIKSLRQ
jgi:hypothetical protein